MCYSSPWCVGLAPAGARRSIPNTPAVHPRQPRSSLSDRTAGWRCDKTSSDEPGTRAGPRDQSSPPEPKGVAWASIRVGAGCDGEWSRALERGSRHALLRRGNGVAAAEPGTRSRRESLPLMSRRRPFAVSIAADYPSFGPTGTRVPLSTNSCVRLCGAPSDRKSVEEKLRVNMVFPFGIRGVTDKWCLQVTGYEPCVTPPGAKD